MCLMNVLDAMLTWLLRIMACCTLVVNQQVLAGICIYVLAPQAISKKNLFKTKFGDCLTKLEVSRHFQLAIYRVFHEESESKVQNIQILQGNLTNFDFKVLKF